MPKGRPYPPAIQREVVAANRERREVQLSDAQLVELGHVPRPLRKVIREFCVDCMGGQTSMIRKCTSVGCALWPLRMGRNPWHRRSVSKPRLAGQVSPEGGSKPARKHTRSKA